MLKIFFMFLTILIFSFSALGAKKETYALLNKATAKYRASGLVQADVQKIVKSELTGVETKYTGKIFLASGFFRLEQDKPEKSVLAFDGTYLWNEQSAPVDFPGPVQVSKLKVQGKDRSQVLFASLLTVDPVTKHFKIISEKKEDKETVYVAEPLKKEVQIKKLIVKINNQDKTVSEITYIDDVENTTTMEFSKTEFKKANAKKFKYQPPPKAQVSEI